MPDHGDDAAHTKWWILPVIIFAQFAGTSLWFAGNGVLADLMVGWDLPARVLGDATSSVQFGFITGTALFALFSLADRFPARLVFGVCAWLGALANAILLLPDLQGEQWLLGSRFLAGFFLAGIYPVGMKIAASWFPKSLGNAMGWLVGALVVGTAFPHLVRGIGSNVPWRFVLGGVSILAASGGLLLFLTVPSGPHLPGRSRFDAGALPAAMRVRPFRLAAFGYFGHMWELYALWAFVPFLFTAKLVQRDVAMQTGQVSLLSFAAIAAGAIGCVVAGKLSRSRGSAWVARRFLIGSGCCCLLHPLMFLAPFPVYAVFMLAWGFLVIGDSAQFSALTALTAPREHVGTALTAVTCVGFSITIASIQLLSFLSERLSAGWLPLVLIVGPLFGVLAVRHFETESITNKHKAV